MQIHQTLVQVLCRQCVRPIKGEQGDLSEYVSASQLVQLKLAIIMCTRVSHSGMSVSQL